VYSGLATSLDTLCAQAYGSGKRKLVGLQMLRMVRVHRISGDCHSHTSKTDSSKLFLSKMANSKDTGPYGSGKRKLVGLQMLRMVYFLWTITIPIMILWYSTLEESESRGSQESNLQIQTCHLSDFLLWHNLGISASLYVLIICAPLNAFMNWFFVWVSISHIQAFDIAYHSRRERIPGFPREQSSDTDLPSERLPSLAQSCFVRRPMALGRGSWWACRCCVWFISSGLSPFQLCSRRERIPGFPREQSSDTDLPSERLPSLAQSWQGYGLQMLRMVYFLWTITIPIMILWYFSEHILAKIVPEIQWRTDNEDV
jgi:hypothetical protein